MSSVTAEALRNSKTKNSVSRILAGCAIAQDEIPQQQPPVVPVETYTCNFIDGKMPTNFDPVVAEWNAFMDDNSGTDFAADDGRMGNGGDYLQFAGTLESALSCVSPRTYVGRIAGRAENE